MEDEDISGESALRVLGTGANRAVREPRTGTQYVPASGQGSDETSRRMSRGESQRPFRGGFSSVEWLATCRGIAQRGELAMEIVLGLVRLIHPRRGGAKWTGALRLIEAVTVIPLTMLRCRCYS